ncbi:aldo-keto reductase-like protein [Venturia nashicola]|nr:aldo-keto reductase-like protein [Venturia nashicola]
MSFGSSDWQPWVLNEADALPLLKHAYDRGINTWDTADVYSNGLSERIIAHAIEKYRIPRSTLVLMTKIYFGVDEGGAQPGIASMGVNDGVLVNRVGLSRKHILDAVEACVGRLGTYIDVLQVHRLDRSVPREEVMRALNDVVEKGWVRYLGASSMAAWEFQALQNMAEKHNWHKFISMQNYYNLLYREEEREMIPYCKETGVGIIPWSPLARGVLTRRNHKTLRSSTDKFLSSQILSKLTPADDIIVSRVEEVARRHGVSMANVATAWSLSKGCSPILGLNSKERIDEACRGVKLVSEGVLDEEDWAFLEEGYVAKGVTGY